MIQFFIFGIEQKTNKQTNKTYTQIYIFKNYYSIIRLTLLKKKEKYENKKVS